MAKITAKVEKITPSIAEGMLAHNTHNRNIVPKSLKVIERALRLGEWELNGEAVKIAGDGTILDGQHRLTACVNTGVSFETFVIRGLPMETQESMDGGAKRTAAQLLTLRGIPNATYQAAIARSLIIREHSSLKLATTPRTTEFSPTRTEIVRFAVENQDRIQYLVHKCSQLSKRIPLGTGATAALVEEFEKVDADDAAFFFERILDGQNLAKGDPIYALRDYYQKVVDKVAVHRDPAYVAAITVKAWNAYRVGRTVTLLRFKPGGANPEKFPEVA